MDLSARPSSRSPSAVDEALQELARTLRPCARVELQASLRDRQNLRRVEALQDLESQRNQVLADTSGRLLRRFGAHAGEQAGPNSVDVGPGAHSAVALVSLRRREARGEHRDR